MPRPTIHDYLERLDKTEIGSKKISPADLARHVLIVMEKFQRDWPEESLPKHMNRILKEEGSPVETPTALVRSAYVES